MNKRILHLIKDKLIGCIIKKSQYRTLKIRHELSSDKHNSKNNYSFKFNEINFYHQIENTFPFIRKFFWNNQTVRRISNHCPWF